MNRYSDSLDKAKLIFEEHVEHDPFPNIEAALLNSADIQDYVAETGMIWPFSVTDQNFKPASYGINFSGTYLYWDFVDGKKVKFIKNLKDGESFLLKRNSIAFIQLEPYLQLPNYIAARFNLQIKHVYRGLLLGTGPLVDPGFRGYLNIPIHNLTDEDYEIYKDEPIIWMEFTKLSKNSNWTSETSVIDRNGVFKPFRKDSTNLDIEYYLHKANPNSPVMSSLPQLIQSYQASLKESEKINSRTDNLLKGFTLAIILSVAGVMLSVGGFFYNVYTVGKNANDYMQKTLDYINKEHDLSIELKQNNAKYASEIDSLKKENDKIEKQLIKLIRK